MQLLQEVGFQAGQHEVLADAFKKEISKTIFDQSKELRKIRETNIKISRKNVRELEHALSNMQGSKEKFRKAFEEQEKATTAFKKADSDGNVSRNDVERYRLTASTKTNTCESTKHSFADQLVKTNEFRQRYYHNLLPSVLDELQSLELRRIELIRTGILNCISKEREVRRFL